MDQTPVNRPLLRSQQQAQLPEALPRVRLPLNDAKLAMLAFVVVAMFTCLGFVLLGGQVGETYLAVQMVTESQRPGSPGLAHMADALPSPLEASLLRGMIRAFGEDTIWTWRGVQLFAFLLGGVILIRGIVAGPELERSRSRAALLLAGIYLAICPMLVMLVAGGSSVGLATLAGALGFLALRLTMDKGWPILALSIAMLWYVHPQGLVLGASLVIAAVGMTDDARLAVLWQVIKALLLAILLIGPGLYLADWRWWWGDPQLLGHLGDRLSDATQTQPAIVLLVEQLASHLMPTARAVMSPVGASVGGWQAWVSILALAAGTLAMIYWLVPVADRAGRLASLLFTLMCFYLALQLWVTPESTPGSGFASGPGGGRLMASSLALALPFGLIVLALAPMRMAKASHGRLPARVAAITANGFFLVGLAMVLGHVSMQQRVHRVVIHGRAHDDMAQWLASQLAPGDTVLLQAGPNMGYRLLLAGRPADSEALRQLLAQPELPPPWRITTIDPHLPAWQSVARVTAELPAWVVVPHAVATDITTHPRLGSLYTQVHEVNERSTLDKWSQGQMGRPLLQREARFVALKRGRSLSASAENDPVLPDDHVEPSASDDLDLTQTLEGAATDEGEDDSGPASAEGDAQ